MTVLSADTNVLFAAIVPSAPFAAAARSFLQAHEGDSDFAISELALVELYVLLRNPAVVTRPLGASEAAEAIGRLRRHPRWRIVDHPNEVMGEVWRRAAAPSFPRGRIFDVRLALGLLRHGVTGFATRNVRDFDGLGFDRVFDPLGG